MLIKCKGSNGNSIMINIDEICYISEGAIGGFSKIVFKTGNEIIIEEDVDELISRIELLIEK